VWNAVTDANRYSYGNRYSSIDGYSDTNRKPDVHAEFLPGADRLC
jgi:hypothetical protein